MSVGSSREGGEEGEDEDEVEAAAAEGIAVRVATKG